MGVIGCIFGYMLCMMFDITSIIITSDLLKRIARIDEFKGAWRSLGTLAPDRLSALRRIATIESIASSTRIEGSKLSDREVESLLTQLQVTSFATRDEQEVAGYAAVMELVFSSWQHIPFTENHIKQLHRDLLKYSEKDLRHRAKYKITPNSVAAFDSQGKQIGIIFETVSPFDTPQRMAELMEWITAERTADKVHPLIIIAIWNVIFLEIHPFQDGNGRLSRILTTLLMLQSGYGFVPYSSLESVIEQNKDAYYLALRRTQSTIRQPSPDWQPWIDFFVQSVTTQVRNLEAKLEVERIVLAELPALSLTIIDFARNHGRVTMAQAIRLTGASRNTLKMHFRSLQAKGTLVQRGRARGTWYELGETTLSTAALSKTTLSK